MRILEIGKYISVAYAGMVLAEQGHDVIKIEPYHDPILDLRKGEELLEWINEGKSIVKRETLSIAQHIEIWKPDVVIENVIGLEPVESYVRPRWISIRPSADLPKGFDILAQAQAFDGHHLDFYIGDTVAGLWAAFLATASDKQHHTVGQGEALVKLQEGELMVEKPDDGWDTELYEMDGDQASVAYNNELHVERIFDRQDRLEMLQHDKGRITFDSWSEIQDGYLDLNQDMPPPRYCEHDE